MTNAGTCVFLVCAISAACSTLSGQRVASGEVSFFSSEDVRGEFTDVLRLLSKNEQEEFKDIFRPYLFISNEFPRDLLEKEVLRKLQILERLRVKLPLILVFDRSDMTNINNKKLVVIDRLTTEIIRKIETEFWQEPEHDDADSSNRTQEKPKEPKGDTNNPVLAR